MAQDVPIPAEVGRQIAITATGSIQWLRENGFKDRAARVERSIAQILQATEGKDGEFVSVDADALSSATSRARFSGCPDSYVDASVQFLQQYNVW